MSHRVYLSTPCVDQCGGDHIEYAKGFRALNFVHPYSLFFYPLVWSMSRNKNRRGLSRHHWFSVILSPRVYGISQYEKIAPLGWIKTSRNLLESHQRSTWYMDIWYVCTRRSILSVAGRFSLESRMYGSTSCHIVWCSLNP